MSGEGVRKDPSGGAQTGGLLEVPGSSASYAVVDQLWQRAAGTEDHREFEGRIDVEPDGKRVVVTLTAPDRTERTHLELVGIGLVERAVEAGDQACVWEPALLLLSTTDAIGTRWEIGSTCEIRQDDGPAVYSVHGMREVVDRTTSTIFGSTEPVLVVESRLILRGSGAIDFERSINRRELIAPRLALILEVEESNSTAFVHAGNSVEAKERRRRQITHRL
jgi:hypothetical protein